MSIAALVLGIIGVVFSIIPIFAFWWLIFIALTVSIIGLVFSIIEKKNNSGGAMTTAALILNIIGLAISVVMTIIVIIQLV